MRSFILHIILLVFCTSLQAQNEYNKWYFGNGVGLDFNYDPPTNILNSKLYSIQSSTSICDKNGNLLFYTDGDSIWNKNHQLMQNWQPTTPYLNREAAFQGCMALPVPGSNHLYYIIMSQSSIGFSTDTMLRYWTIDMDGDGGLGMVIAKERPLFSMSCMSFGVTKHANKTDYWIGATEYKYSRTNFKFIRTVNGEFTASPIYQIFPPTAGSGQFLNNKFSPDSKIFTGSNPGKVQNNISYLSFDIFHFDNSTGLLSDKLNIPSSTIAGTTFLEFSPDSRFLYIFKDVGSGNNRFSLVQYDLSVWDSAAIKSSATTIITYPGNSADQMIRGFQLGPDGKIYCFNYWSKISVIEYPNKKGAACSFKDRSIQLSPGRNNYGGPYYPNFYFQYEKIYLGKDTIICKGDSVRLICKAEPGSKITWNTGDTTNAIIVKSDGIYIVNVTGYGPNRSDTIKIQTGPKFKVFIGNDTAFCRQFSHLLNTGTGFNTYNWNTGSTATQITVNSKGIYSVKALDSNSCPSGDTIAIDEIKKPGIKLSYDSVNCKYVYLSTDSLKGLTYVWSTGQTQKDIKINKKGWISITASHQFCSNKDSVYISHLAMPEVDLGIDTDLCIKDLVLKTKEQGQYIWSTMETRPSIVIREPGKYWLTVSRNNCTATDTINVKICEDMLYYIPDAFSPNDDNINEVFRIYGSNIAHIEMEIFNRWGELLLKTSGKDVFWDGMYKNEFCMNGVYFYKITIKGKKPDSIKNLNGSITLLK